MKKNITSAIALLFSVCLLFSACKKKETPETEDPVPQESGQASADSREAQSENDVAMADINTVIMDHSTLRGRSSSGGALSASAGTICGLSVDTAGISGGSITLNFNGTTCNNRTRTGAINVSIQGYAQGSRWRQKGSVLQVQYINYKVTRASDQKSIELNGTQFFTNESGGGWLEMLLKLQDSLITSVAGNNLQVKFDNSQTATYNINRRVTYTLPGDVLTCMAEGTGTSGSLSNLENFGTTRSGDAFTSQVTTPIVWNITCGAHAPLSGEVSMQIAGKSFALLSTFGTDANGNPVSVGANQCPYGWKLSWTYNGNTQSGVHGYK